MRKHLCLWRLMLIPAAAALMGASLHKQTSVDPASRLLEVELHDQTLAINPDAPESRMEKYPDGSLETISYQQVGTTIVISFHHLPQQAKEKVAQIQRYRIVEGRELLDGPSRTFDIKGNLLTETNWSEGRLHGRQSIYDSEGQLREEKEYAYGHPVGTWRNSYPDGQVSMEIRFPTDLSAWESTEVKGGRPNATTLPKTPFFHPLTGLETWYAASGKKEKERELRYYLDSGRPVVEATGISRSYGPNGEIIRETSINDGNGWDAFTITSGSQRERKVRHYINGQLFKEETGPLKPKAP